MLLGLFFDYCFQEHVLTLAQSSHPQRAEAIYQRHRWSKISAKKYSKFFVGEGLATPSTNRITIEVLITRRFPRCIRFNTNQERKSVTDSIKDRSKTLSVLKMTHRTVWCTRIVQLQTSHSRENGGTLHFNSQDYPVSQQSNGSLRDNGHLPRWIVQVRSQSA